VIGFNKFIWEPFTLYFFDNIFTSEVENGINDAINHPILTLDPRVLLNPNFPHFKHMQQAFNSIKHLSFNSLKTIQPFFEIINCIIILNSMVETKIIYINIVLIVLFSIFGIFIVRYDYNKGKEFWKKKGLLYGAANFEFDNLQTSIMNGSRKKSLDFISLKLNEIYGIDRDHKRILNFLQGILYFIKCIFFGFQLNN
jgi:hypothetical protein